MTKIEASKVEETYVPPEKVELYIINRSPACGVGILNSYRITNLILEYTLSICNYSKITYIMYNIV